jgi:cellulose synthase/poly-beta-1,6-N-acetylglucosamine synthase-like glycosyltransferase
MNSEQTMILVAVVTFIYVQLIMRFTFGWFSLDKVVSTLIDSSISTTFSVIIAARNEEQIITRCLEAIALQNYPVDLFEVIIVNDHSTDLTKKIVDNFIAQHPGLSVRLLDAVGEGKKRAISEGIHVATGQLILVTDADCLMSEGWIRSFAVAYEKKGFRCISGPVKMTGKGIFAGIQGLEFMSLISSGAGSISAGMPVMCNGANFCYERVAFETVGGFEGNDRYASGDDVFLMLKINKHFGSGAVTFLKDRAAIITTTAQPDLQSFFRQRMRWTSKSPGYTDFGIILTAVSVLLINLGLLIGFGYGLFFGNFQPFLFLLISKLIIDFPLLIAVSSFMHQKRLLAYYLPVQLLMPFYVVFTALGGLLSTVSWKGRPVK